jgi:hypothetical protein
LILRKLYNQRVRRSPFDQQDLLALISIHKGSLDLGYIRERARNFRLAERFETLLKQVGG